MDTPKINHISLCAGYGGIDIGLRRILPSLRNLAYCEIEVFPLTNLVSKIESGQLDEAPIFTNLKTFNAKPFRGLVDILSGGFPCQPFSSAGNKKSTDDPRHLFPDIERIILECEPRIIFLENVEGIISSKLGGEENTSVLKYVLESLEKMDYRATAGLFSAEEISAPHRRKRIFIAGVRNSDNNGESTLPLNDETSGMPQHSELSNTQSCGCGRRTMQTERKWGESQREGCEMGGKTTRCHCSSGKERLGNTEHDGSSATQKRGSVEKTSSRCEEGENQTEQSAGTSGRKCDGSVSEREEHGELGDTTSERSCRGGKDKCEQQPEVLGARSEPDRESELSDTDNERLEGSKREREAGKEGESIGYATELHSEFPSKPGETQQWWEFPRTIGETEEIITPLGCSTYGIASSLVHSNRVDALRLLGNGVVPDCAAKAFVCLMHELNENAIEEI